MSSLPHSPEAEAGFVAKLLVDPSAIPALVGVLSPDDFHDETYGKAWEVMAANAGNAGRVDATTLKAAGVDIGDPLEFLNRATSAPAREYAAIITRDALRRRAITALRKAEKQVLHADEAGVYSAVQEAVTTVISQHRGGGLYEIGSLVDGFDATTGGISWGLSAIDRAIQPIHGSDLVIIAARPNVGKALPLSEPVLTPKGWTPMGTLSVGDLVIGGDGKPCRVTGVFPQGMRPVYRVVTSDGERALATWEHLWLTRARKEKDWRVRTTQAIAETLMSGVSPNHAIPVSGVIEFEPRPYPESIHPYVMGVLLGDGGLTNINARITNPEVEIQERVTTLLHEDDKITWSGMDGLISRRVRSGDRATTMQAIQAYGLDGKSTHKFIPDDYLMGSKDVRIMTLAGLLDTDGYVTAHGRSVEYATSSPRLAEDVMFLARSLGAIVSRVDRVPAYRHRGELRYGAMSARLVIRFPSGFVPVTSDKHLARWKDGASRKWRRSIRSIDPGGDELCQCITVDSPDNTYITRGFIVTHNSAVSMEMALSMARGASLPVMFTTIEMSRNQLLGRLAHRAGGVEQFREGYNLVIHDEPGATTSTVRAMAAQLKVRYGGIKAIYIDYLQILSDPGDPEHIRVQRISKACKGIAREFDVPVIAMSQLNRASESRDDRRPRLADLRDSGAIEQDADMVLGLYRPRLNSTDLSVGVLKNRHGRAGDWLDLFFDLEGMRVEEV